MLDPLAAVPATGKLASLRGASWMVFSCACFAGMAAVVRHVSTAIHPFELVFFRSLFQLLLMVPWLWYAGMLSLRTQRLGLHTLRALGSMGGMLCWFLALSLMPIAEMVALSFTSPLFCTVGAALFLREKVSARRWMAVAVGFGGAMIILRPGLETVSLPALLALAGSLFWAAALLPIKALSRTDSAGTIVLYAALLMLPLSAVPAGFVWSTPGPEAWLWLFGIGLLATCGSFSLVYAFSAIDASAAMPFDFSRLIFAALFGYVFFAEYPDLWTWIGAAIIVAAAFYATHQESHIRKAPVIGC